MKTIIVVYDKEDLIFPFITDVPVCEVFKWKPKNIIFKLIIKILVFLRLNHFVYGEWYKKMVYYGYTIIYFDMCGINKNILSLSRKYKSKIKFYLRNPTSNIKKFKILLNVLDYVYSFDLKDCSKYGFHYKECLVPSFCNEQINGSSYDLYFVGLNKNRRTILNEIREKFSSLKCEFIIFDKEDLKNTRKYEISYKDYIIGASQSKCIVEILQNSQSSETLRTVESIMLGKKLLTNNLNIKKCKYFNENNVFVFTNIQSISEKDMIEFLNKPVIDTKKYISDRLPIAWVKGFWDYELN